MIVLRLDRMLAERKALGMLLIAVGIAFDYGVVLQRQDDELL